MKVRNFRIGIYVFMILVLVFTFAGYLYTQSKQSRQVDLRVEMPTKDSDLPEDSIDPEKESYELEDLNFGIVDMELILGRHPKNQIVAQLEDQIHGYINEKERYNADFIRTQEQIASQFSDLNAQLNTQLEAVRGKYEGMVNEKVEELQKALLQFEEETWNDALAKIQRKKDDLQAMAQGIISREHQIQMGKVLVVEQELNTEYNQKIFNLQLKLTMVQLTETEKKRYTEELETLRLERERRLEEVRLEVEEILNAFIDEKQEEMEKELIEYQSQMKVEVEKALLDKQNELDNSLQSFISRMEQEMQKEILDKQSKLDDQAKRGLLKAQEDIEKEIKNNERLLTVKIEEAYKELEETLKNIDAEIRSIVAELATKQGLDVVLTDVDLADYGVNVIPVNLTEQVLQKLSQ